MILRGESILSDPFRYFPDDGCMSSYYWARQIDFRLRRSHPSLEVTVGGCQASLSRLHNSPVAHTAAISVAPIPVDAAVRQPYDVV